MHSIDLMLNEIYITDLIQFIRINKNVLEANKKGIRIHNDNGKQYKFYKYKVIQPEHPLDKTFDFSEEAIQRSMNLGLSVAKRF